MHGRDTGVGRLPHAVHARLRSSPLHLGELQLLVESRSCLLVLLLQIHVLLRQHFQIALLHPVPALQDLVLFIDVKEALHHYFHLADAERFHLLQCFQDLEHGMEERGDLRRQRIFQPYRYDVGAPTLRTRLLLNGGALLLTSLAEDMTALRDVIRTFSPVRRGVTFVTDQNNVVKHSGTRIFAHFRQTFPSFRRKK